MALVKEDSSGIKVQIVTSFPDLEVYVTKSESDARNSDSIWCFSTSSSATKIKFVTSFADLKISYVTSKSSARWKNKTHKLQNRIR